MRATCLRLFIIGSVLLSACGGGGNTAETASPETRTAGVPADAPGHANSVPVSPAAGESRPGRSYSIYITAPATGDTAAFTVHEPATLEGGRKYPVLLYGHGGGEQRITDPDNPQSANSPFNDNIGFFIGHGYGVISMDQRGHGESSGSIRLMDPDYEGRDLLALLDWAEARLDWLAYGPSADGSDPHNLVLGAIGASYGGGFQMLVHDIDPRHRLDAIVPEATWHDIRSSLMPNGVFKSLWGAFLFPSLTRAGSGLDRNHLDPYVQAMATDLASGKPLRPDQSEFLHYHGNAYFCGDTAVASNGGPDTAPLLPPLRPRKVHAMFWQGMRDTLFNFNEAWHNYECLKQAGGDVRLLSYQVGHNTTPVIPDPGALLFQPPGDGSTNNRCGGISVHDAALAFFDEHLKGIRGAADVIPRPICLSLSGDDAVVVERVIHGRAGIEKPVPATSLLAGLIDAPVAVDLGIVAGAEGAVIAGIPRLEITVTSTPPGLPGEPIVFAGIGLLHARAPGVWELLDNQLTPLRGSGDQAVDMVGVAEKLEPGDRLALLLYGGSDQYPFTGSINAATPTILAVTVQGRLWVPMLGPDVLAPRN